MQKLNSFISVFYLISILILPSAVLAIGQVTEPIIIENALRGEGFQQTMTIVNGEDKKIKVDFLAEGDIAGWVEFFQKDDLENSIENIQMLNKEKLKIIAKFTIPSDTLNGEYAGLLSVFRRSDANLEKGKSTSVSQKVGRDVTITVSDEEIIQIRASIIPDKYGLSRNEPLAIRIIYDNQGNVSVAPQIQFKIKKDEQMVYNMIHPYPENESLVKPLAMHEIPIIEIPTNGLEDGRYITEVNFLHNGNSVFNKNFSFTIGNSYKFSNFIASIGGGNITFGYILIGGFFVVLAILIVKKRIISKFSFKKKKIL